ALADLRTPHDSEGPLFGVQLRDKRASRDELRARARTLRALTALHGVAFIVNGDADLAAEVDADAVHVPGFARDRDAIGRARAAVGPLRAIHVPVHTNEEVARAQDDGADALLVSPIFDSPGKGPARGVRALMEARARLRDDARPHARPMRIYALGGIDAARARACRDAGADGVAVIRALLDAPDPVATARALVQ
ncbi:MAG TPA: thiamine phosphate synthase, partial [Polyangiaceae bacterium]|nr:thiamine phosphate synthase [Polyangiaceae bacterium]